MKANFMKIYLASRYSRREELCGYRQQLQDLGHVVTSRWLNGDHQLDDKGLSVEAKVKERTRFSMEDWEDLKAANCTISFTEIPRSEATRGGRHVEFGGALAMGHRVIVVGHRENVFHCMPQVEFYQSFDALLCDLKRKIDPVQCICGHTFDGMKAKVRRRISDEHRAARLTDDPIDYQCPKCLYWVRPEER